LIPGRYCEFKDMFKQSYVIAIFTRTVAQLLDDISAIAETILSARASKLRSGKVSSTFPDPSVKAGIV
jgi:hypothetical protein